MKNLLKVAFVALVATGLSFNLYAGKGVAVTGSVELIPLSSAQVAFQVDGEDSNEVPASWPTYGDQVSFNVQVDGRRSKNSDVFVSLTCYTGGSAYYHHSEVAPSDFVFTLDFEQWKDWLTNCTAELIYQERKGGKRTNYYLDVAGFTLN